MVGATRDITQRMQAEKALRQSEEKYRSLFENAEVGMFRTKLDGTEILAVNQRYLDIFGRSFEEMMGSPSVSNWADVREREEMVRRLQAHGRVAEMECRMLTKRGEVRNCLTSLRLYGDQGILEGSIIDITDRKRAEEQLCLSETALRQAQKVAHVGSWVWHIQTNRLEWSDEMYRIFGIDKANFSEDLSEVIARAIHPDDRDKVNQANKYVIQNKKHMPLEYRVVWPDQSVHVVWAEAGELNLDQAGNPAILTGIVQDITDRKQAEEERERLQAQLLQAQKMEAVGRLAAGVAHDFNNQLTVIRGYADILLAGCTPADPLWEPLSEIRRASERAHSTTNHLLSFSRKQMLHPERCDVNELLKAMRGPVTKMIGEDIKFTIVADPGARPVLIDPSGMQQAIMNLIVNARDAMPNGGELVLRTQNFDIGHAGISWFHDAVDGQYTLVEVRDSGVGMNRETLERVFDPFFTTKAVGEGTGLGLPMVQGFVKQSHGFIDIRSEPGKGTVVRILLPAEDEGQIEAHERQHESDASLPKSSGTILVVEDEEGVRNLLVRSLRTNGYEVLEASTPSQAIAIVTQRKRPLDLLITDMVMPEMNGADLAKRIKSLCKPIRTLFITGYANEEVRTSVRNVLLKPFSMDALLGVVRETLGR